MDEFGFWRKFFGYLVFGAAENERGDALLEDGIAVGIAVLFDGIAEHFLEALRAPQKTRHQKVKKAPHLAQMAPTPGSPLPRGQGRESRYRSMISSVRTGVGLRNRSRVGQCASR